MLLIDAGADMNLQCEVHRVLLCCAALYALAGMSCAYVLCARELFA
jgi:hypothetical protein